MYVLDYSLDNLSLMALTLSVGFVVDDAIVMLENIVRHMEKGEKPMQAAFRGSREIGFTIVSMTLSLAAVFIPVLFMGGIVGRLLHEFAVTIGAAILVSGFVSLSLTPMLCSRFLRPYAEVKHGKLYMLSERFFDGMLHLYDKTLQVVLRHKLAVMVVSAVVLVATGYLFVTIPKGFLASEDQGQIYVFTEAVQGISFEDMKAHEVAVARALLDSPDGKYINTLFSAVPRGANNQGFMVARFVPLGERPGVDEIMQRWRPLLAKVPGIQSFLQNPPLIRIGGQLTKSQYQYTLQSPDTKDLYDAAPKLEAELRKSPHPAGRHQRPADEESASQYRDRSRQGRHAGRDRHPGRGRALHRLQLAPDLHHLRAQQCLSRGHGTAAAVPGRSLGALAALRALLPDPDRHATTGAALHRGQASRATWGRWPSITSASCRRSPSPSTPSRAWRWATRSTRSTAFRAACCPTASPPASRARRRPSSRPSRAWASCSSWPSWSSTSCWEFCTRASSTRSRFCPDCRRRAWARCSPSSSSTSI